MIPAPCRHAPYALGWQSAGSFLARRAGRTRGLARPYPGRINLSSTCNPMKRYSLKQLFAYVFIAVCLTAVVDRAFFAWRRDAERTIRSTPTSTTFGINKNSSIHSSLTASETDYSLGSYGVMEVANTRIAVRGYVDFGSSGSSGAITLATDCDLTGAGGSHGGSGHYFAHRRVLGGSHCVFGPISFDIIDGIMYLLDREFDVINGAQCIIIDGNGAIEEIVDIPSNQDPPDWEPAEQRIAPKKKER